MNNYIHSVRFQFCFDSKRAETVDKNFFSILPKLRLIGDCPLSIWVGNSLVQEWWLERGSTNMPCCRGPSQPATHKMKRWQIMIKTHCPLLIFNVLMLLFLSIIIIRICYFDNLLWKQKWSYINGMFTCRLKFLTLTAAPQRESEWWWILVRWWAERQTTEWRDFPSIRNKTVK